MKALTIHQPWATLVAIAAKRYETRSWRTDYRGPLAIHAGAREVDWMLCQREPFRSALAGRTMTRGGIIAIATLADCLSVDSLFLEFSELERAFGDYSPRRYAWLLEDVTLLTTPIPTRGHQMLWDWDDSSIAP